MHGECQVGMRARDAMGCEKLTWVIDGKGRKEGTGRGGNKINKSLFQILHLFLQ